MPAMLRMSTVLCLLLAGQALGPAAPTPASVSYEAFAVRFGILPAFSVAGLVAGADRTRRLDIPVMVWLLKGTNGRIVLVDSGFYRQKFIDQWKPRDYRTPAAAVAAAGVNPEAVTDIVISHAHWDHVDGADLFPNATIWIQREEYRYYTGEAWHARTTHGGVDADDMQALLKINIEGRLRFVEGDDQEIIPGIRCYTGGKHTWASQYVSARLRGSASGGQAATAHRTAVFTSDNVYLYENLEKRAAIAQTLDAASNLKAQDRIRGLASDPRLIVPGHDPAVLERFERVSDGIVRIK
jgi:glyoxylase-like metal-dependent hydrolase (beta-lactamase superfamily II)